MRRAVMVVIAGAFLFVTMANEASAGGYSDGTGDTQPTIGYTTQSYLSPTHLGGYVVADAEVTGSGSSMLEGCWAAWAATWNWKLEQNAGAIDNGLLPPFPDVDGEPIEGIPAASIPEPDYCTGIGAQLTEPDIVENTCPPGTVFAVRTQYHWWEGNPPFAPGKFVATTITFSDTVDEIIFNFCLDVFVGHDPAEFEELIPEPQFARSPNQQGVTGLETWLWYDFDDPQSHYVDGMATVEIIEDLPLTLYAQAWVDKVLWDMDGDGEWDEQIDVPDNWNAAPSHETYLAAGGGNSELDAAATYLYETKGVYPVNIAVVWRGVYRYESPLLDDLIYPYEPVVRTSLVDYPVIEIITRIVDTG